MPVLRKTVASANSVGQRTTAAAATSTASTSSSIQSRQITSRAVASVSSVNQTPSRAKVKTDKDLEKYKLPPQDLPLGRPKRTPKPNRKYFEDSVKLSGNSGSESEMMSNEVASDDGEMDDVAGFSEEKTITITSLRKRPDTNTPPVGRRVGRPVRTVAPTTSNPNETPGRRQAALAAKRKIEGDKPKPHKMVPKKRTRQDTDENFSPNLSDYSETEDIEDADEPTTDLSLEGTSPATKQQIKVDLQATLNANFNAKIGNSLPKASTQAVTSKIEKKTTTTVATEASAAATTSTTNAKVTQSTTALQANATGSTATAAKKTKTGGKLEDFEKMPTFTIVNINDIINQKDDVIVLEKDDDNKNVSEQTADDEIDVKLAKIHGGSNRRKAQHTIRSDKMIATTKKTTSPILTLSSPLLNDSKKPYRNIIGNKNGKFQEEDIPDKVPPRILNSALCKNVNSIQPMVSKIASIKSPPTVVKRYVASKNNNNNTNNNNNNNNNINNNRDNKKNDTNTNNGAKENNKMLANNINNIQSSSSPSSTMKDRARTCTETVMGNRRIRKITCYETWFVIRHPPTEMVQPSKCWLSFPLMKLGNDIKQVTLPTDRWSYKISLSRIHADNVDDIDDVYTGEVHDPLINPSDRHLYQPVNIMFRRACQNGNLRMQFDRAVILKNQCYFVHVDGKSVKLLSAPEYLEDFEDIDVLLEIVDNITLLNPYVEQSALVR